MTLLIQLNNAQMARMLIDYLATQHIPCELRETGFYFAVWLLDDQFLTKAEQEVQRFVREPNHPRYQAAAWSTGKPVAGKDLDRGNSLWMELTLQARPFTLWIACLTIAVFAVCWFYPPAQEWLMFAWPWESWQVWRLITPAFLHFSVLHILFNLCWWWYLGNRIEKRYGGKKLLVIWFVASLIPNILQALLAGDTFGGLSGVAYALLGYAWLRERLDDNGTRFVSNGLFGFMVVWLVIGFANVLEIQTANLAHLGGLCIGLIQGWQDHRTAVRHATGTGNS